MYISLYIYIYTYIHILISISLSLYIYIYIYVCIAPSAVATTESGYLDGVTGPIQTQLNSKQTTLTGSVAESISSRKT